MEDRLADYTYTVSRLNALESDMPDRNWFQRLARGTPGGILGSIREYFSGFESVGSLPDFEEGLAKERKLIIELLSKLITEENIRLFLFAGYDFDNMSFLWKSRVMGREPVFNDFGLVDAEEAMRKAVEKDDVKDLPFYLKELYEKLDKLEDDEDTTQIECLCEREKWKFLLDSAPSNIARSFTVLHIDIINIKNFIRLKRIVSRKDTDSIWLDGGEIETSSLKTLYKDQEEDFISYLTSTSYRKLIKKGVEPGTPLWKLDPLSRVLILDLMYESRYRFFDISPILYHLELRERNEQLLRSIITGKLNGLPEVVIIETIDMLFVN